MVNILSIDPSLSSLGYSVFIDLKYIKSNTIKTKIKNTSCNICNIERLYEIKQQILELFDEFIFDYIIIEGYSYTKNSQSLSGLYELGGILKLIAYENNCKIIIIPPTLAKKYLDGKNEYKDGKSVGLSNKEITFKLIKRNYNIYNFDTTDEADSFLFGEILKDYLLYKKNKNKNNITKNKEEVFYMISNQIKEFSNCKLKHYFN